MLPMPSENRNEGARAADWQSAATLCQELFLQRRIYQALI